MSAPALAGLLAAALAAPGATCPASALGPESGHAMAYHAGIRRVVLLTTGGSLWSWDGRAWTCLTADGPSPRTDAAMTYDPSRDRLVVVGGRGGGRLPLTDTWAWDRSRWTRTDTAAFSPRVHSAAAYDATSHQILLYGGGDDNGILRDTWRRSANGWIAVPGDGPDARVVDAMAPTPDGALLVTARLADTPTLPIELWRWSGAAWQPVPGSGPSVSPVAPAAWTRSGLVLFAGWEPDGSARAWLWNGRAWSALPIGAGLRRKGTAVAYDEARDRLVLFGGDDGDRTLGDTWEWDGTAWTKPAA
ncbi:MAG: hypothetical protein ABI647_22765 [Gemmatimonadota bacterium]